MRVRHLFVALLFAMGVGLAASPAGAVEPGDFGALFGPLVQQNPPGVQVVPDVDVDVHKTETERLAWYTDPLVIGSAVVVLIVVVALVARGGTTIVKD